MILIFTGTSLTKISHNDKSVNITDLVKVLASTQGIPYTHEFWSQMTFSCFCRCVDFLFDIGFKYNFVSPREPYRQIHASNKFAYYFLFNVQPEERSEQKFVGQFCLHFWMFKPRTDIQLRYIDGTHYILFIHYTS